MRGYDQSVFSFGDVFIVVYYISYLYIVKKNKTNNIYILYLAGIYDFGTIVAHNLMCNASRVTLIQQQRLPTAFIK